MFRLLDPVGQIANMGGCHGAVTDKEIRILLVDLAHHRASNFDRLVMGLGLYCIGAVVARTAFNGIDVSVWHQI